MGSICDGIVIFPPHTFGMFQLPVWQPLHLLFLTSIQRTTSQIFVPEQEINHHVIISTRR